MQNYLLRLKWPDAEAFSSPEALQHAIAENANRLERILEQNAKDAGSIGREGDVEAAGVPDGGPSFGRVESGGFHEDASFGYRYRRPTKSAEVKSYRKLAGGMSFRVVASDDALDQLARTGLIKDAVADVALEFPDPEIDGPSHGDVVAGGADQRIRLGLTAEVRKLSLGEGVRVSVIDSGLDRSHAEFKSANILEEHSYDWYQLHAPTVGTVSYIKTVAGKEFEARHYHGTAVAGLLAGARSGIAPQASLIIHNVFYKKPKSEARKLEWIDAKGRRHRPNVTILRIEPAIMYSLAANPDILLMSFGTKGYDPVLEDEILTVRESLKKLFVVAAGNHGAGTYLSPGDYKDVLTVGAIDGNAKVWPKTSGGIVRQSPPAYCKPDIYAPGVNLKIPVPKGVDATGYLVRSGTSFAAPIVAGAASLVLSVYRSIGKTINPDDVRHHLLETADDIQLPDELGGTGKVLNIKRAVTTAGNLR